MGVAGRFAPRALPRAAGFSGCEAGVSLGAAAVRADLRTFSIVVASLGGWTIGFQIVAQKRKPVTDRIRHTCPFQIEFPDDRS